MPTVRCDVCRLEQELPVENDPYFPCKRCGNRPLRRIDE